MRPTCKCHGEPMEKNADVWRCNIRRRAWKRMRYAMYSWQYKQDAAHRARLRRMEKRNELHA